MIWTATNCTPEKLTNHARTISVGLYPKYPVSWFFQNNNFVLMPLINYVKEIILTLLRFDTTSDIDLSAGGVCFAQRNVSLSPTRYTLI